MISNRIQWLTVGMACLGLAGAALASDARPTADDRCVMQCDTESDRCMADSNGDEKKAQACDDRYTKCLQECR